MQISEAMELDSSEAVGGMDRSGLGARVVPAGRLRLRLTVTFSHCHSGSPQSNVELLIERSYIPPSHLSELVYDAVMQVTAGVVASTPGLGPSIVT